MKIVEINSCNFGSTGNIMLQIVQAARECGHEVITSCPASRSNSRKEVQDQILIGNRFSRNVHLFLGEATGMNGLFSVGSTLRFLRMLDKLHPDLIHLHNLHNCYINLPLLFRYIKKHNISVVWTLHDCWAFTGRCPYFQLSGCDRWKTGCHDCPYPQNEYPATKKDRSNFLWKMKKKWFTGVQNMTIVTPSQWLADLVKESFLSEYPVKVINNGIDLNVFKPSENDFRIVNGLEGKKLILAVAMGWDKRKGYADMLELAKILDSQYRIVMVGVSKEQLATLPSNILGIERTNSQKELAEIYSASDVFVNTTYEDNYPTVNLEARACGLPVITYKTGGSPESAGADATLVETGDVQGLKTAIEQVIGKKNVTIRREEISSEEKFAEYTEQYNSVCVGGVFTIRQRYNCVGKFVLLGVAFGWSKYKGLDVFIELAKRLDPIKYQIILVGTDESVDKHLPENIISIHRTQNQVELAQLYTAADLFVNPTREEVLGMVNIEALACGTPVITFRTGGSPECISKGTGIVVDCGDVDALYKEIDNFRNTIHRKSVCIKQARYFDAKLKYDEYIAIYDSMNAQ